MVSKLDNMQSKTILFCGSKGGSGCSFVAYCVSAYLAKNTDKNILLLDLNNGKKDSRIIFDISSENSRDLGDIEEVISDIDEAILRRLVINFDNSLNLVIPSLKLEKNKILNAENLESFLDIIKKSFDIICIDFPYYFFLNQKIDYNEYIDKHVIISLPDLISINNLSLLAENICGLDLSFNLDVVINKYNLRPSISPSRLNSILKYPVKAFIPYDRDIELLFLNKGPFSIFNYRLQIVKSLAELSKKIYEDLF